MARTTWGPLSTDEQNSIEFAPVGEPGVLVAGTAGGLLKRNADGTIGNSILSESGSVLTAAGRLVISGGTVTASTPVLDLSQTWNLAGTTFTGMKFNVTDSASATASSLAEFQVGGVTVVRLAKSGSAVFTGSGFFTGGSVTIGSTLLYGDGSNILSIRNLANAQTLNVYGTTDAGLTNYRRLRSTMTTGGAVTIAAEGLGTGVSGNTLALSVNGITPFSISSGGTISLSGTVSITSTTSLVDSNVVLGTTTGTKLGTATTQKLGFWNATPIVQPSGTGETVGFTAGAGTPVMDASTFTGNVGATAYRLSDIVKALKNSGLIAS